MHELRVTKRWTTAALRLYADMLPRRRTAWMETRLKQIRRAAGDARDYDVLAQWLSDGHSAAEAQRFLGKSPLATPKGAGPIRQSTGT